MTEQMIRVAIIGGVEAGCFRMVVGEGTDAGKTILDLPNNAKTIHRAALLKELLASIPRDKVHLNKRLSDIQTTSMHFSDGTSAEADPIIGADGIHGSVSEYVLGEGYIIFAVRSPLTHDTRHPAISLEHAGFWDGREVVSLDLAASKLGADNIDKSNPLQQMYFGNGRVFFHAMVDDAQRICIVVAGVMPPD